MSSNVICIDFGTSNLRAAVFKNNKMEVLVNRYKSRVTPTYVSFRENEILIGEDAKSNGLYEPENTIYDIKYLIGLSRDEKLPPRPNKNWLFSIDKDEDNSFKILLKFGDEHLRCHPEDVATEILLQIKKTAITFFKHDIKEAIMLVPTFFNNNQRSAIISICRQAGLTNISLLSETVATAITYIVRKQNISGNVLVLSLGDGPFDISLLRIDKTDLQIIYTLEDSQIGGQDFTEELVKYFTLSLQENHKLGLNTNKSALWRLRQECENLKKKLSFSKKIKFFIHAIMNRININETITREKFNELNANNFISVEKAIKKVLTSAEISYNDIDKVILSGGSARIPKIQDILKEFASKDKICILPFTDEIAINGTIMYEQLFKSKQIAVHDILPRTISYRLYGSNISYPIFLKNHPIYNHIVKIEVPIGVKNLSLFEGETNNIVYLGDFSFSEQICANFLCDVEFSIDNNRILNATALYKHKLSLYRNS